MPQSSKCKEYLVSDSNSLEERFHNQSEISQKSDKVLVIGLGQLGLPVAKYVKERGFDVYGYDISTNAMDKAEKIAGIKKAVSGGSNSLDTGIIHNFDVCILTVSTHDPKDMSSPQIDGLLSQVETLSKEAKTGALLSIESTVPKGTSRKIFEILKHRMHVVHAPHRWYALEEEYHGVNQPRVIGGVLDCCLKTGMQFYNGGRTVTPHPLNPPRKRVKSLEIPMHQVQEVEIAEITKIAENAHRYLQIAFAEELYLYCQLNGLNFTELREALNTKWNVNILEPREGIGGHCLPKDTKMFLGSSNSEQSKILNAAMEVDLDYRVHLQLCKSSIGKSDFGSSHKINSPIEVR